jgi:uncharacterized membrane protein SpoIIM required for sporulation
VDLDAFSAVHGPTWTRLEQVVRQRHLTGAESDELVRLYQTVATHLSTVRSTAPDPALVGRLSDLLARARARITGAHDPSLADVVRFFRSALPAALYRVRWWTAGVTAGVVLVAVLVAVTMLTRPGGMELAGTPAERAAYANEAFESYYSEHPHASFAAMVWTNNAWVAALCVAFGITGVGTAWVLLQNAVAVGSAAAVMAEAGYLDLFFQLILPHGLLELTCVFVAGGAGLKLFWTWIDPGGRPRGRALAHEGLALVTVVIGLALALGVSGVVEGFVTPSTLPWPVKIAIGAVPFCLFWAYVLVLGRRAVRAGETGGVAARHAADELPVAA